MEAQSITVDQEYLDLHPELAEKGVAVGDVIELSEKVADLKKYTVLNEGGIISESHPEVVHAKGEVVELDVASEHTQYLLNSGFIEPYVEAPETLSDTGSAETEVATPSTLNGNDAQDESAAVDATGTETSTDGEQEAADSTEVSDEVETASQTQEEAGNSSTNNEEAAA